MAITFNADTTNGAVITSDTSGEIELQANGVTKAKVTANGLQDANGNSLRGGSYRNLIINGDMQIAQRGTSFANANGYTLDRWRYAKNNSGVVTVTQDTDAPSGQGFSKSLKIAVTTADTSIGTSEYGLLTYFMEGQNLQHLKYGTSNAEKITVSFWVKSNKTGTYCVAAQKLDTTRYDYVTEYTINSANTWEKKTITIAPDSNIQASSGVIDNDNGIGLALVFALADGADRQGTNETWNTSLPSTSTSNQVNFLDSTSNYINITGAQLEVGEGASNFEFLPYDVQWLRCQRYYEKSWNDGTAVGSTGDTGSYMFLTNRNPGNGHTILPFKVKKRANATVALYATNSGNVGYGSNLDAGGVDTGLLPSRIGESGATVYTTSSIALGNFIQFHYVADAEL